MDYSACLPASLQGVCQLGACGPPDTLAWRERQFSRYGWAVWRNAGGQAPPLSLVSGKGGVFVPGEQLTAGDSSWSSGEKIKA